MAWGLSPFLWLSEKGGVPAALHSLYEVTVLRERKPLNHYSSNKRGLETHAFKAGCPDRGAMERLWDQVLM